MSQPKYLEIYKERGRRVKEVQNIGNRLYLYFAYYYSKNDKGGGIIDRKYACLPCLQQSLFKPMYGKTKN
jgi:hypothetical protein